MKKPSATIIGIEKVIWEALNRASPNKLSTHELIEIVYASVTVGDKREPSLVIVRHIESLNRKLSADYLKVKGKKHLGLESFEIERIPYTELPPRKPLHSLQPPQTARMA